MTLFTKKFLYWTPRLLSILFALFVSLFALDVFQAGENVWTILLRLLMHLIPTFLILIVLAISWRWEWIGGLLFIALGLYYIFLSSKKFNITAFLLISGPLFLIGLLFLVNWLFRKEIKSR